MPRVAGRGLALRRPAGELHKLLVLVADEFDHLRADGRNCMLHQFPIEQRGFVTCHQYPMTEGTQTGTMWIEGGPNHLAPNKAGDTKPAQGQGNIVGLTQGYVYPNVAPAVRGPGRGQPPPTQP